MKIISKIVFSLMRGINSTNNNNIRKIKVSTLRNSLYKSLLGKMTFYYKQ